MRVLTFLHSFEPGGVERVALRLVRRWRALGVDTPLFLGRMDGPLRAEFGDGLTFDVPRQPPGGTAYWETLWMILMLPAQIRRQRPDVLFCAGNTYTIVAVMMKLLFGRHCPPILVKISNDLARADLPLPARLCWYAWLRIQALLIDRWVVMDEALLPDVATRLGAVDRVVIADPAIDALRPATPAPASVPAGPTRYLGVGRLAFQKNPALMLTAFSAGSKPGDTLTLFGDGPLRPELERLAKTLGIADAVIFAGHVPDAASRMASFDVLLMTSRYEGVPAVIVEALAAGMRIVAMDCGPGVRALLRGGAGTLVPQDDVVTMVEALRAAPTLPVDVTGTRHRASAFTLSTAAGLYVAALAGLSGASVAIEPLYRDTPWPTATTR